MTSVHLMLRTKSGRALADSVKKYCASDAPSGITPVSACGLPEKHWKRAILQVAHKNHFFVRRDSYSAGVSKKGRKF